MNEFTPAQLTTDFTMNDTNAVTIALAHPRTARQPLKRTAASRKECRAAAERLARLTKVLDLIDEDVSAAWSDLAVAEGSRAAHDAIALRIARMTKLRDRADAELDTARSEHALAEGRSRS